MKTSLLIGAVCLATAILSAQQPPGSTPPTFPQDQQQAPSGHESQQPGQMPPDTHAPPPQETNPDKGTEEGRASAGPKSIEGCLAESSVQAGGFTVTDASGKVYELRAPSSEIREHLNEQVRVTGTLEEESSSSASSGGTADRQGRHSQSIAVTSIDTISKSCQRSQ